MAAAKGLIGLGGLGSIAGGAYLAKPYIFSEKDSIETTLTNNKWEVLKQEGQDSLWEEIYNKYKEQELDSPSRFDKTITKGEDKSTGLPKLKGSCQKALSQEFSPSLYRTVTRWCVTPISAADRLEKLGGYKKINVEETNTTADQTEWTAKETEFKKALDKNNSYLGVTLPSSESKQVEANIKLLKAGCKKHMDRKNYDDDFEGSMEKVNTWCGK
ncbi:hypothetical protein MHF_1420 [Mycoplasma haemofelis Ohio2]|uniref:Uncharacterized protein n=1 Tax=Mycoplasma haemofelis (strain Ohio2) TaxID=859194 RepID=F6FGL6_MYCHI|nr:hypothetical protein MHF_1420 [Mycoplasma haemofelis Ohio2]